MTDAIVQELRLYPLKSARGIAVAQARLTGAGLERDRHWLAIGADGRFLTQRTHPALARIRTALSEYGLRLETEGLDPLDLPYAAPGPVRTVRIWRDSCAAVDQGEPAAQWISAALATSARLVRTPDVPPRRVDPTYAGRVPVPLAFADGYPLLVCNQASLDALNSRLPAPISMERFRPNIVLAGLEPFAEDRIAAVQFGPIRLHLVKPCTRCSIPSIDPRSGRPDLDPLPVLRTFRFDPALRGVTFGENAIVAAGIGERIARGARGVLAMEDGEHG